MRWYRLAAEQGLADAQNNLGLMYANGEGLPDDYVLAYQPVEELPFNTHKRKRRLECGSDKSR